MIEEKNQFYETAWVRSCVREPSFWSIHDLLNRIALKIASEKGRDILEIGPGTWPKSPISRSVYLEPTVSGINKLVQAGGYCIRGFAEKMPFPDDKYPLICAFEVLEHIERYEEAIREVSRVIKPGGFFIFSTPVNMDYWSDFDVFAGHVRRFSPKMLSRILKGNGFEIIAFQGRKDSPKLINDLNARLRISSPRMMDFLTDKILDLLERSRNRLFTRLFQCALRGTSWKNGRSFPDEARFLGNVTVIAKKRKQ